MINLKEARTILAPYVDGGVCDDDPRVAAAINRATQVILNKGEFEGTTRTARMCVSQTCLTLPREFERVIKARVNGRYADVWSKWYEFIENGPGLIDTPGSSWSRNLRDREKSPTQFDLHKPLQILVFSDQKEDEDAEILIRGFDETHREVGDGKGSFGERIPIQGEPDIKFSKNKFDRIISVQKPKTNGYVYIAGFDPATVERFHLSSYHPSETIPEYRRYAIPNIRRDCSYLVDVLVKLAFVPIFLDSDLLQIQNIDGMIFMLQALRHYDAHDRTEGLEAESLSDKRMNEELRNSQTENLVLDVQMHGYAMGDIPRVQ